MVRSRLETWAPWKQFLLVMLYSLLLLSLLCTYQGEVSEAQDLPQVKIPSSVASDDGQWRMAPKDYANLRYSDLDQITTENIKNLHVAFTFSTGVTQGHEAVPLVVDNTMYIVTPYPNYLYALDLTQPGAPVKSIAGQSMLMAESSITRWMDTRLPWTRRPARSSGKPNWAISIRAKRSRWRRWS